MSAPLLTPQAAEVWLNERGWSIHLHTNDPRSPLPDGAWVNAIEAVRQVAERDEQPSSERVTPCPQNLAPVARKSLTTGLRVTVEQVSTLRRGALELAEREIAHSLWKIAQDLSALAGKVEP